MKEYSQNIPWKQEEGDTAGQCDFKALLNFKNIPSSKDWPILGSQGVYRTAFTPRAMDKPGLQDKQQRAVQLPMLSLGPAPLFHQFHPGSPPKKVFMCLWTATQVQAPHV